MSVIYLRSGQLLEDVPDDSQDLFEAVSGRVVSLDLHRRLRELPPLERRVLRWRFGIGGAPASCREVAARLGVSADTAWRIEQRALSSLRRSFGLEEAA